MFISFENGLVNVKCIRQRIRNAISVFTKRSTPVHRREYFRKVAHWNNLNINSKSKMSSNIHQNRSLLTGMYREATLNDCAISARVDMGKMNTKAL
jgi:DNA modification methylase